MTFGHFICQVEYKLCLIYTIELTAKQISYISRQLKYSDLLLQFFRIRLFNRTQTILLLTEKVKTILCFKKTSKAHYSEESE